MKDMKRDLVRSTLISIGTAMTIFCLIGVVFDVHYGGRFSLEGYRFTKMVIGCVLIGLGFGVPSVVYRMESMPMPLRVIIHLGIGWTVYLIVAFAVGWMGSAAGIGQSILIIFIQTAVIILIWFLFFRHYKKEADEINRKLAEKDS